MADFKSESVADFIPESLADFIPESLADLLRNQQVALVERARALNPSFALGWFFSGQLII